MATLESIKDLGNFPISTQRIEVMCQRIDQAPHKVYEIISFYGGESDTVTREEIFNYIADKQYAGDYDKVYLRWLSLA